MADHFPLPVFFAEDVGGAEGDLDGLSLNIEIFPHLEILHHRQILPDEDLHFFGFDGSSELGRGLDFPLGAHVFPTDIEAALGSHVGDVVAMRPDFEHGTDFAGEHGIERFVELHGRRLHGSGAVLLSLGRESHQADGTGKSKDGEERAMGGGGSHGGRVRLQPTTTGKQCQ